MKMAPSLPVESVFGRLSDLSKVTVLALKSPLAFRRTKVLPVLEDVPVVAEFATFPAVAMGESLESLRVGIRESERTPAVIFEASRLGILADPRVPEVILEASMLAMLLPLIPVSPLPSPVNDPVNWLPAAVKLMVLGIVALSWLPVT